VTRLALVVSAIVDSTAALAAETEHAGEAHGIPWGLLFWSFINTAIFLWVFFKYLWPFVCGLMGWAWTRDLAVERRRRIVSTLEQAANAKREAELLRAEWERRLAALAGEIEALQKQARDEIARERDRILANARKAAEAIRRDAQRAAEQEVRNAQALLREEVAERALAIARRLAEERLSAADKDRFVDEFVKQVTA